MSVNSLPPSAARRLPITVINGFAGAGKTSVLNHLLRHRAGQRTAVIVSDHSPAAVDAAGFLSRTEEKVVRLATDSGSHAFRADLLLEAGRLARQNCFDYLLIENPGPAELAHVARTFSLGRAAYGLDLPQRTRLDTLATVVDASRFLHDFHSALAAPAASPEPDATPRRAAADVLTEQVESANVIVLNKADLASGSELDALRALMRLLNPVAQVVTAEFGQVNPAELLYTGRFDATSPSSAPLVTSPEADAHGLGTLHFRDERPFHPGRLWQYVRDEWPAGVLRSKGLFWLASRPDFVLSWDQAGPSRRMAPVGSWWAAAPGRERDPVFRRDELALLARWHPQFQDRVNTLQLITQHLNPAQLRADLENCLCTPLEVGRWRRGAIFPDPWPHDLA